MMYLILIFAGQFRRWNDQGEEIHDWTRFHRSITAMCELVDGKGLVIGSLGEWSSCTESIQSLNCLTTQTTDEFRYEFNMRDTARRLLAGPGKPHFPQCQYHEVCPEIDQAITTPPGMFWYRFPNTVKGIFNATNHHGIVIVL